MPRFLQRYESVWLIAVAWLVYATWAIVAAIHGGGPELITDDAMRLAQVRDLLNGQSWYDTAQWRMNTPFGLPMHWSRLVDAAIAIVYLLFRIIVDSKAAETATLYAWPLLPFLALLAALYRTARLFGGRAAACIVLVLALLCVSIWSDYAPGSLDHHNVQLALMAWMLAFLVESETYPRAAGYAALVAVTSLVVGIETLPFVMTAAAAVALLWVCYGSAYNQRTRYFGLAFAAAGAAFTLLIASRYRFAPACDTYSSFYALLAIAGGAGIFGITFVSEKLWQRALLAAGLFAALVGIAAFSDASCLRGPYAEMDPRLYDIWFSHIIEVKPAFVFARYATSQFVFGYVYAVAGLLAALALFASGKKRATAGILLALTAMGIAVSTMEIRAVTFPIVTALPAIAWLVSRVFLSPNLKGAMAPLAGFLALALCTDTAFAIAGGTLIQRSGDVAARISSFQSAVDCGSPAAMKLFAALPKGRVAAFVDQGPAVLAYTGNSVMAGPYHRNAAGILDDYALFAGAAKSGAAVLRSRGIAYVMTCRASGDWNLYLAHAAPDALIRKLAAGSPPPWLRLLAKDSSGNVALYSVDKAKLN